MIGSGTLVNFLAIIFAGIIGCTFGKKIPERVRDTLLKANAIAVIVLGIGGTVSSMLVKDGNGFATEGSLMMILSLSIGGILGEVFNLEDLTKRFGTWLKKKSGNAKDAGFVDAFVNASLTVCIGAMAIVGAIEDGIAGDPSILYTKAILDFVIILVMSTTMGKGCAFAAIPVGILQGSVTLLAKAVSPLLTDAVIHNISYIGSILILCVGINLFFGKKIKVANLLPSLIIAGLCTFIPGL